ncbi:unnamed protein product [Caenorhabditis angaria]|uniref:Sdz-33 F-box domain-containing protein n=1 Tax=Caenorhabditis angaria TaxID=860376 RepID=A0A9P1I7D3_9PELO|nr:unnamed protein product [Caenorhabditis angaria]
MITDQVELDSLGSLAKCSKKCSEEVMGSKNYVYSMELIETPYWGDFELYFTQSPQIPRSSRWFVEFEPKRFGPDEEDCEPRCKVKQWKCYNFGPDCLDVDIEFGNLIDIVITHVNQYLERHKDNLVSFKMTVSNQNRNKLMRGINIPKMKRLKHLWIGEVRNQLCMLKYKFIEFEQLKTLDFMKLPATILKFDQLIQLRASYIHIYYMKLTPKDLGQYLKLWQEGKLHRNIQVLKISAQFNKTLSKRRISVEMDEFEYEKLEDDGEDINFEVNSSVLNKCASVSIKDLGLSFVMSVSS